MKIVQFVPYFYPYVGGQENYIYNLSKQLIDFGHHVQIITSNYPKSEEFEIFEGIFISRYRCFARIFRNPIPLGTILHLKSLKEFDIIHIHNEHSFHALLLTLSKRLIKKPVILTCHGQLIFGNVYLNSIEKIYSKIFGKFVFSKCDKIIVLSKSDEEYILSFGIKPNKIEVIPNAIDHLRYREFFFDINLEEEFIERYKLSNRIKFLFVGQIIERKGLIYLLNAINLLKEKKYFQELLFIVIGNGDLLKKLEEDAEKLQIKDNIIFTGTISEKDLCNFYSFSDFFILPSLSEGLPTTILEAMFFKLPVISTDIPGIRDHFLDKCYLVPPADDLAIANGIDFLLNNPDYSLSLSKKGKEYICNNYVWNSVAKKIETLYFRIIKST